jgi:hypothetical protein
MFLHQFLSLLALEMEALTYALIFSDGSDNHTTVPIILPSLLLEALVVCYYSWQHFKIGCPMSSYHFM